MNEIKMTGDSAKLLEALGKARLKFSGLVRDSSGQVGNKKFKYMPLGTLVSAIEQALVECGISFVQPATSTVDECTVYTLIAGHGGIIESSLTFKKDKNVQEWGRELTYHRRYALQSFLVLEGDDDADAPRDGVKVAGYSNGTEAAKEKAEDKAAKQQADKALEMLQRSEAEAKENEKKQAEPPALSLKDQIYKERDRLGWDTNKLTSVCKEVTGTSPYQTNDEQKKQLLTHMSAL